MLSYCIVFLCIAGCAVGQGNWTTSPFNPPSMPLAVKSPSINVWAPLGFGTAGSDAINRAVTRAGNAHMGNVGWSGSLRVDGKPYNLLGDTGISDIDFAVQDAFLFTPTRSSYSMTAGPIDINMTFLSPIEATDLVRLSMPFSYLYITAESNDGIAHDVQVYTDITGEWVTGDAGLDSNWSINQSSDFVYLQIGLTSPSPYQEINDSPQDAVAYYAAKKTGSELSWQIGPCNDIRRFFVNGTGLNNQAEAGHHAVNNPYSCLGLANDIGSVSTTSSPIAYAVGVVRDPVVQYTNALVQMEERSAYYWSNFSNIHDAIEDVLDHFNDALSASILLDNKIIGDASQISSEYAEILSLSTRQAMSALEYTLLRENGEFNTSDVKAFMKDMGGIGSGGVNAVDVIYAAMPIYLYLNPAILGYLLSPLMDYQESTQYGNLYAAQDLGTAFPNATGNPQGHDQKIEHTASMVIMSLAHAQGSGDGNLLAQHYDLLNGWASYLVNNTMTPGGQTTSISDNITTTNQTNLVLKGIIGIGAMAKISELTGHNDDQSRYDNVAKQYVQQWTTLVSASNQLNLNFGSSSAGSSGSSGLIYNLYADKLLQLGLLDSTVYELQTSFYRNQTASPLLTYGIPLDTTNTSLTRTDWMMFAASSASDDSVRNTMISQVHGYASIDVRNLPFPVLYSPFNAAAAEGVDSPAQGAMFAPLALNVPIRSVTFTGASGSGGGGGNGGGGDGGTGKKANVGIIVGATVGGIACLAFIGGIFLFYYRRHRERRPQGMYNQAGRIERIHPTSISASVLEPLSATQHPGMSLINNSSYSSQQSSGSGSYASESTGLVTVYPATMPPQTRILSEKGAGEIGRTDDPLAAEPTMTSLPRSAVSNGVHQEEWRSEMDDLRREIVRIREERAALGEAPPSYEEEAAISLRSSTAR